MNTVDQLLRAFNYDVERAAGAFFDGTWSLLPQPSVPDSPDGPPSPLEMDRSGGEHATSKRARPPDRDSAAPRHAMPPPPFVTAAMGSLGSNSTLNGEHGSIAQLSAMMGVMAMEFQGLKEKVGGMPDAITGAIPAAVRAHDENEQVLARQAVESSRIGGIMSMLDRAQSMADLGKIEGITWDATENFIKCDDCFRHSSFAPPNLKNGVSTRSGQEREGAGVIHGTDLVRRETDGRVRRGFTQVRFATKLHFACDLHEWCSLHAVEKRNMESIRHEAGLNLARLVLQNVKEHDSDSSYERRVATANSLGVNVGTKNHSRRFVPRLRKSMRAVCNESFTRLLSDPDPATKRPPAFAVMADKATVMSRTGQMVGIILMVCGILTPIFVSTLIASEGTGLGLATLLQTTLTAGEPLSLSPQLLQRSLTCFAFDGQYQGAHEGHASGLDVASHFCSLLSMSVLFAMSRWDDAHRIELGMNTVRSKFPFYLKMAGIISNVHEKYLYGKGIERVRKAARYLKGYLQPAAIGHVCTTRFCHSERKVYKNFFRNLPLFVSDLLAQGGVDAQLIPTIACVTFVLHLAGLIDILAHVKDLSLLLETVDEIPWELEEQIRQRIDLISDLSVDLEKCDISRTLDASGKRVPAFPLLKRYLPELKQLKLSLPDPRAEDDGDDTLITIDLQPSATRRVSRSTASQAEMNPTQEVEGALKELGALAKFLSSTLHSRLQLPDSDAQWFRRMSLCLDFRKMKSDADYCLAAKAKLPLKLIYDWLRSRLSDLTMDDMPTFDAVWDQFVELCSRMRIAAKELPFAKWRNASGTIIKVDIFTNARFYHGCHDYLYLWQHCATKTMCEAVVEGMGSVWDRSATPIRHPNFETGVEESVIAWSAPWPWHPSARPFLNRSLDHLFGSRDKWVNGPAFHHVNQRVEQVKAWDGGAGKVVAKLKEIRLRLPTFVWSS